MHIYENDFEMLQEHGIQRSHEHENVFYDAIARVLRASCDLELVGSHVMSLNNNAYKLCDSNSVWLTKATFTTSLSILFQDEFVNLW